MLPDRNRRLLSGLVLLISAAWFIDSALSRPGCLWDFGIQDASSHAWLKGENPYDGPKLWPWWAHSGVGPYVDTNIENLPPVAPPSILVVIAPIALLPPRAAVAGWIVGCLTLLALQLLALVRLAELPFASPRALLLMSCVLLMGPLKMGFIAGQACIPAVALVVLGVWAASTDRPRTAGLLLALATAFKIQLGLPFILIYLFLGRLRVAFWAVVFWLTVVAIALVGLHSGGTNWLACWIATLQTTNAPGGLNDFASSNPYNFELLNFQLPLNYLIAGRLMTNVLSICIGGALIVLLLIFLWKKGAPSRSTPRAGGHFDHLFIAAIVAPLLLLPVYHRYYDALILTLTMAWVFREMDRNRPTIPRFVGVMLLLAFFTPDSLPVRLAAHLPAAVVRLTAFDVLIYAHRVWFVFLIGLALLYELMILAQFRSKTDGFSEQRMLGQAGAPAGNAKREELFTVSAFISP
jgi:hypothetical protein